MPKSAASEAPSGPPPDVPPSLGSPRGRKKKMTTLEKFEKNGRVEVSKIASGTSKSDLYLAHLNMILKQVTFRLNMYKLSADYYDAKDVSKYQYPIEFATVLASMLQCSILVLPSPGLRTKAALAAGALGLFVSSWNSLKNSEKLNVKGQLFKGAEAKYKDLARGLVRLIVKRKASYADPNGPPPTDSVEAFMQFRKDFKEKYETVQELQQAMHFFPPKKLVAMWLNSGVLTGEKPERMRRRKFMPETGKPPEPGEGYEVVADDDYGSDNEEWDYEDMPTQNQLKERRVRRKAKRRKEQEERKEKRLVAVQAKREETAKRINALKNKAKETAEKSTDPAIRAKIEEELKLAADEEAKHQADEEAENVALIETESADLNADFVGEDECGPEGKSMAVLFKENRRRGSKIVFENIEKAKKAKKDALEKKRLAIEAIEKKKKEEEFRVKTLIEEKKREAELKAMEAIEEKMLAAMEAVEKKKAEVELKAMEAIEEKQREALEAAEEKKKQVMESQFANELNAAKEAREAEYKKQEATYVEAGNSEPFKGQNMAKYDKKFDDIQAEQGAKLQEARAAQAADYEAQLEKLKAEQLAKVEEMRTGQQNALEAKKNQMKELQAAKMDAVRSSPLNVEKIPKPPEESVMEKKRKALEAAEEKKRADLEKQTAKDLDKAHKDRDKDYKKQEAAWNKSNHKEPYDGQNLEVHDEKISELEDTQAKLEDERAKEAMVKNIVSSSTKESIEEKRMAMETMFAQDLKKALEEREAEYKKQEAAWVAAGNSEKYNGQNLESYDEKIKQLKSGHSKYEKALNVLEYTMDHKDILSDPLDDPLLLHTEILDSDSDDEIDAGADIGKLENNTILEEDFIMNARFLLNKIYYRRNMYVLASQHADARDKEVYFPMMFVSAVATCFSLAITSPLAGDNPKHLALVSAILGFIGMRLSAMRQADNYMGQSEVYSAAANEYRRMSTRIERRLRTFRTMPPHSPQRLKAIHGWKPFFAELTDQIKNIQSATIWPVSKELIEKWQDANKLKRNNLDQPEMPSRVLQETEKNEAFCLVNIGRAKAIKESLVSKMLALERADKTKSAITSRKAGKQVSIGDDSGELELQRSIADQSRWLSESNMSVAADTGGSKGGNLEEENLLDLEAGFGGKQKNI